MNETWILNAVKEKAYQEIFSIEHRTNTIREYEGDVRVFKTQKYVEDRGLEEYLNLLPELRYYLRPGLRILDVGCGDGKAASELNKMYGAEVTGTVLKKRTGYEVPVTEALADKLPFADNTFDIAISVHGISWEPNQVGAIKELCRVIKPGGTAHIYLIKFSHSIALFGSDTFWNNLEHERYKDRYEFNKEIKIENCIIQINEYVFPEEECEGYYKEWGILIRKLKSKTI